MSQKLKIRITFFVGLVSWLLFTFFDIYAILLQRYEMQEDLATSLPQAFLTLFILSTLFYYRYKVTKAESVNFIDLLWTVFVTGLITTLVSLVIQGFFILFKGSSIATNTITINFFYHIYSGAVIIYLISTLVVWKRLILYQKSKNLIQLWNFFEYSLYGALIFDFFGYGFASTNFNVALVFLTGFSVILSLNLKWIAYLNFKQKWKSILFILLSGIYLYHFRDNLAGFSNQNVLVIDLMDRVFIVAILIFIFLYALIAVLVTLFNLPTSSVFERKLKEAVDFQKLSQSIPSGQSEIQTYEILLDSSMSAVFADAAWLEVMERENEHPTYYLRNVNLAQVTEIKSQIKTDSVERIVNFQIDDIGLGPQKIIGSINGFLYRSILALPIYIQNEQVGCLVLLQEVSDAFNREMVEIIRTFVSQASISLENALLIKGAIENERYKEQLNIAKNVQNSLLPQKLDINPQLDIATYSMAADEVGGDYYDIVKFSETRLGLIIGDVSGKGTSAAFNMAQVKGIFHSLTQFDLSPDELIRKANLAVGKCLERSSFITASYFVIESDTRKVQFVRAGHCPTLLYRAEEHQASFLSTKGMGMGILRNSEYDKYVHANDLSLQLGDLLVLHTDGITEATNRDGEQFGEERLQQSLMQHVGKNPTQIKEGIIADLYSFSEEKRLDDDYTLVIVKFE